MDAPISKGAFICFLIIISVLAGIAFIELAEYVSYASTEFYVVDASLNRFNLVTNTTDNTTIFSYNLTLDVKLRNPSKKIGIRYRRIRTGVIYKAKVLAWITLPPFYQGHKNTTMLHPMFQGQPLVKPSESDFKGFSEDQSRGSFDITISFYLDITFKLGSMKFRQTRKMLCDLKLLLGSDNVTTASVGGFKTEECYESYRL